MSEKVDQRGKLEHLLGWWDHFVLFGTLGTLKSIVDFVGKYFVHIWPSKYLPRQPTVQIDVLIASHDSLDLQPSSIHKVVPRYSTAFNIDRVQRDDHPTSTLILMIFFFLFPFRTQFSSRCQHDHEGKWHLARIPNFVRANTRADSSHAWLAAAHRPGGHI